MITSTILIIIRIGIVEFVPKENPDYSLVDEFPDLNIYEKIQILIYESEYINREERTCKTHVNKINYDYDTKTLPIPIPKKKR